MSQKTTYEKYGLEVYPFVYGVNTCTGATEIQSYTSRFSSLDTVSNDIDQRTKPKPDDLILSQTAQAKQSRLRRISSAPKAYGYRKKSIYCDGEYKPNNLYVNQSIYPSSLMYGDDLNPDWGKDLRLEIKDISVNLGTSLVEYRQTANMFSSFAKGSLNAWRDFRRGRFLKGKKITPCNVAASELAYSYGVAPLAGTLYDSAIALNDRLGSDIIRKVTSFSKERDSGKFGTKARFNIHGVWDREVSSRSTAYVKLEPEFTNFTVGNPLELAWEVIPYSFVIDWAIDIGGYLSALDALKDVKSLSGSVTTKEKYKAIHYYDGYDKVTKSDYTTNPAYLHYNSHERNVITSVPLPRVPKWEPSMGYRRVMHALSLLTVLTQKCP